MDSSLADYIESHRPAIVAKAVEFATTIEVGEPLDTATLRDHLPEIIEAIILDLRAPQTRNEEIAKSEGRAPLDLKKPRSAAGTHAMHRAHSGYSISNLVSEYRALRSSVLRMWTESHEFAPVPTEITRFNEAIDEAIAESVSYYSAEVERWRDIFLGVLGHDLRSPLSAILLSSEYIARTAVDVPVAKAAERVVRSGKRMSDLLEQLLVYNRTRLGVGFVLEKAEADLIAACRDEIEIAQASLPRARVLLNAPRPVSGVVDAGRIREALANLISNASKYGAPDADVHVELREVEGRIELAVRNQGPPIEREMFDSMFDPLRRGTGTIETQPAGLGLGLFIVSQIAKAHGGSVSGESSDGITTFRLQFPNG